MSNAVNEGVVERAAEVSASSIATFATLMHKSLERLADLQKATLDALQTQTTDLNKAVRDAIPVSADAPLKSFFDLADQSVTGWVATQKTIIDLVTAQSAYVAGAAKDKTLFTKPVDFFTEAVKGATERTVEAEKSVLDYAAAQNRNVSEVVRKQTGVAGTPVASATQAVEKNVGVIIDAHKEALDTAAKLPRTAMA